MRRSATAESNDLRVCFVSLHSYGHFDPDHGLTGGGAERQLSLIGKELASSGFDVHFLVGDHDQAATVTYDDVTLHRTYLPTRQATFAERLQWLGRLVREIWHVDADVYVHRGTPAFAAVIFLLATLLGKDYVYNIANDANVVERPARLGRVRRSLFERGLDRASGVIAQTEHQRQMLGDEYGRSSVVVPNGYPDVDSIRPHEEREFVLWVGQLDRDQKRPHRYLDLAERCPDVDFVLIGPEGTETQYNREIVQRSAAIENVEFLGELHPEAVHDYFERAIALVNTSAYEGFPNVFLEAWRMATPVISLDVDPNRFVDSIDGGYADGDFDRLVDLTMTMVTDVAERRKAGEGGREAFQRRLRISNVASQYGRALERFVQG